jgi:hypothetical protein
MTKAGTWRVVVEGGAIGELTVDVVGGGWHRVSGQEYHPATPLRAAIAHAAWARDWAVAEIVAPGALTRAEALRDARDDLTACERLLAMTEETAEARDAELTAEVVRLRAAATTGGEGR